MPNTPVVNHSNRLPIFLKKAGATIARTARLGWKRSVQVIKKPLSFIQRVLIAPIQRRFSAAVKWIKGSHLRIATKVSKATARLRSLVRRKPSAHIRQITQLQQALDAAENAQQTAQEQHAKKEQELQDNLAEKAQLENALAVLKSRLESYEKGEVNPAAKIILTLHARINSLQEEIYGLHKQCEKVRAAEREATTNYTRSQEELEALKKTLAAQSTEEKEVVKLESAITAKD